MLRFAAFALLLFAVIAFIPCPGVGADEPFVVVQRRDSSRSNATGRKVFEGPPKLVWRSQTARQITSPMFEHGGRLYLGHATKIDANFSDGYLLEMDSSDGKVISERQVFGVVQFSPFMAYDRLFFISSRSFDTFVSADQGKEYAALYEFLPDDTEFIRGPTLFNCSTAPLPSLGLLTVSEGPAMRAVDIATFDDTWRVEGPESFQGSWFSVMPLLVPSKSLIVSGAGSKGLIAVSAADGKVKWTSRLTPGILPEVCHDSDRLYCVTTEGDILCLSALDGTEVYRAKAKTPVTTSLAVSDGSLYGGLEGGGLGAFSAKDGSLLWEARDCGILQYAPLISSSKVLFGTFEGNMCCLDTASGKMLWRYRAYSTIEFAPAISPDGLVYFSDDKRVIYCLGPSPVTERPEKAND